MRCSPLVAPAPLLGSTLTGWWGKDSNLRRREPADLQSAPVGRLGTPPVSPCTRSPHLRRAPPAKNPCTIRQSLDVRADGGNRTHDLPLTRRLLCHLSYVSDSRSFLRDS